MASQKNQGAETMESAGDGENGINRSKSSNQLLGELEEEETMDLKARALAKLLQTSDVFVSIMAERMKEQQKQQKEKAQRQAAKERAAEAKEKEQSGVPERRSVRAGSIKQPSDPVSESKAPAAKQAKLPSRGRAKEAKKSNSISSYFKKADVDMLEDKPSVQDALVQAADEYEAKPPGLGEQDVVATQQPALVTGGKMRQYQLEGLEWLKSLFMNGLSGILADEMGLGKTVQTISLIAFLKEMKVSGPFLIVAPLSTLSNWIDEFSRWTPTIKTILYHGSKEERSKLRAESMKIKDQRNMDFSVICTSYDISMNDRKFLAHYDWRYIVVDEGHRLKNMDCRLIKELKSYKSANRLLITGTPLQNNVAELWSLLHFLLPEVFDNLGNFESWFDFSSILDAHGEKQNVEEKKRKLVSKMHAILKPFVLRRVKSDVENSLPKKREYVLYAPLTPEQKELYLVIMNGTSRQYLEGKAMERIEAKRRSQTQSRAQSLKRKSSSSDMSTPNKSLKSSRDSSPAMAIGRKRKGPKSYKDISEREFMAKLNQLENGIEEEKEESDLSENEMLEIERAKTAQLAKKEIAGKKLQNPIMQARLACNSPHNFYWPWDDPSDIDMSLVNASGKMLLLDRLIPCLMRKGHKILIFSQFKTQLDILQDWAIHLRGWKCCRIDGAVSQVDRRDQIKAFNADPDYKIFLLSTRAGGQGINLTAADTVIIYDSDWNPQQDLQAQDRAHRIGQTKPVIVYRLATKGTVEQRLLEKADTKRKLEKLVIRSGKFKSLLDNSAPDEDEDLRKVLGGDDLDVFDVGTGTTSETLLSDRDLEILTDRSEEAYARADQGLDTTGNAFLTVKSKQVK